MKFFATSFCQTTFLDNLIRQSILAELSTRWQLVPLEEAECVILVTAFTSQYKFHTEQFAQVAARKLPIIVLDYFEHRHIQNYILLGHRFLERLEVTDYALLHCALAAYGGTAAYFKRELPAGTVPEVSYPVHPIDFTVNPHIAPLTLTTEEEYHARPIDICFIWGYSNESRPLLFAELIKARGRFGMPHITVNETDVTWLIEHHKRCQLALLYQPFYNRLPLARVFELQSQAKVTISLFGAGNKCFRSAEAGQNSVVAHQAPETLEWAIPWVDGINCLALPNKPGSGEEFDVGGAVEKLYHWLRVVQGSLYSVYVQSVLTTQQYRTDRYVWEYLVPRIEAALSRRALQLEPGQEAVNS